MSEYITGLDTSHWEDDVNLTRSINWQMVVAGNQGSQDASAQCNGWR